MRRQTAASRPVVSAAQKHLIIRHFFAIDLAGIAVKPTSAIQCWPQELGQPLILILARE